MRILRMQATFGCLENAVLTPEPGMNVLVLPNGGGKSTWCAFLLAMLYGLDTGRRSSRTALSDRERYQPWSGAPMAGQLEVEWEGRPVTIERTSRGRGLLNTFRAADSRTGQQSPELTAENCGQMLTGVERTVFVRSAFLTRTDLEVSGDAALERRLGALAGGEEPAVSRREAEAALRQYRNRLQYNRTGRIPELEAELQELRQTQSRQASARRELEELQAQEASLAARLQEQRSRLSARQTEQKNQLQQELQAAREKREAADAALQALEDRTAGLPDPETLQTLENDLDDWLRKEAAGPPLEPTRTGPRIAAAVLVLLAVVLTALLRPWGALSLVLLIPAVWLFLRRPGGGGQDAWQAEMDAGRDALMAQVNALAPCDTVEEALQAVRQIRTLPGTKQQQQALTREARERETLLQTLWERLPQQPQADAQTAAAQEALAENRNAQARLAGALETAGDPQTLQTRIDSLTGQLETLRRSWQAADAAMQALDRAAAELEARVSPALRKQTETLYCSLTGGRFTQVTLDRDFRLRVQPAGQPAAHPALALSTGERDLLQICLRLAVAQLLAPGVPLILDDALTALDRERLQAVLTLLAGLDRQILIFSCQEPAAGGEVPGGNLPHPAA